MLYHSIIVIYYLIYHFIKAIIKTINPNKRIHPYAQLNIIASINPKIVFPNPAAAIITTRRGALKVMPSKHEIEKIYMMKNLLI